MPMFVLQKMDIIRPVIRPVNEADHGTEPGYFLPFSRLRSPWSMSLGLGKPFLRRRSPTSRKVATSLGWSEPSGSGAVLSVRFAFCAKASASRTST